MDVESTKEDNKLMTTTTMAKHNNTRRNKKKICIWSSIGLIVILGIIFTILGVTVFKVKKPTTTVNSTSLEDFKFSFDIARLNVNLNVTVGVDLTIKNPNGVGFKYSSSKAILKYRDQEVGEAPFPAGSIGSHGTSTMNVSVTLMGDRLLSDRNLYSDAISGTLPFTTDIKLTGKVQLVFKIKVTIYTVCDIGINVFNRSISSQSCRYRTKL